MTTRRKFASAWDEIEYLYHKLLHWLYGPAHRPSRARPFAEQLERLLRGTKGVGEAILGQECWSLVCEVKGDLRRAIRHRERTIALIRRFVALPEYPTLTPGLHHDDSSIVDHLVLLAMLHGHAGNRRRATASIEEARAYAAAQGIAFEAEDIWRDFRLRRIERA